MLSSEEWALWCPCLLAFAGLLLLPALGWAAEPVQDQGRQQRPEEIEADAVEPSLVAYGVGAADVGLQLFTLPTRYPRSFGTTGFFLAAGLEEGPLRFGGTLRLRTAGGMTIFQSGIEVGLIAERCGLCPMVLFQTSSGLSQYNRAPGGRGAAATRVRRALGTVGASVGVTYRKPGRPSGIELAVAQRLHIDEGLLQGQPSFSVTVNAGLHLRSRPRVRR